MEPPSSSSSPSAAAAGMPSLEFEAGKLFVGGISSDTGEEALSEHFSRYGQVKEVLVLRDRVTGKGRGFGFVQFAVPQAAEKALEEKLKHVICGKQVEVKRATRRSQLNGNQRYQNPDQYKGSTSCTSNASDSKVYSSNIVNSKKIFIGGLPDSITQDELKSYFEKFGPVVDAVVMFDSMTQRPRGFGFITFASTEPVSMVLQNSHHELNGKPVEVKIAVPRNDRFHTYNRDNDYRHNSGAIGGKDGKWPLYGPYQSNLFPIYGYYGYYNYVPPPVVPYPYGGIYGGNDTIGRNGMQYGGLSYSPRSPWHGMLEPVLYPSSVKTSIGSSIPVADNDDTEDHGVDGSNEKNPDDPDVEETVNDMSDTLVAGGSEIQCKLD